jgi:hypothetical protein
MRAAFLGAVIALTAAPAARAADASAELQRAVAALDAPATIKAIDDLGNQGDEKAVKTILAVALRIDEVAQGKKKFTPAETNEIFEAAKKALVKVKDPKAHKLVFGEMKTHKDWRVRVILVDAITGVTGDEADEALCAAVLDKHPTVAGAAIRALANRRCPKAFDPIITVLERTEKRRDEPWLDAMTALVGMSGVKELTKASDWKNWWETNRKTYDPAKAARGHGVGETVMRDAPKILGVEVLSKRCVFILDVSGSMNLKDLLPENGQRGRTVQPGDPGYGEAPVERMRMWRLQDAMEKCIQALPEDTKFTIITFGSHVTEWNADLQPANAKNKAEAIEFAKGMHPEGYTWTDTALERAFEIQDANTFYLFSDGIPQRGKNPDGSPARIDTNEILEKVAQLNRVRKVKIYTIGIGEADPVFMAKLAAQNDGTFTPVK